MLELEAKSGIAAMEKGHKKMGHGYLEDPTSETGFGQHTFQSALSSDFKEYF